MLPPLGYKTALDIQRLNDLHMTGSENSRAAEKVLLTMTLNGLVR